MENLVVEFAEPDALVALRGGKRIGSLRWRVIDNTAVELVDLWLAPGHDDLGLELRSAAEELAAEQGHRWLTAAGVRRRLPIVLEVPTAATMHALGVRLSELVRPGDLLILSGDLGAGKTTLTQGIGAGLGVEGPVTSPTFVLSRIHRGAPGKPDLVHVDAYRLGSLDEMDDIDLDSDVAHSVTVIEWGAGVAEQLAADRLDIEIRRALGSGADTRDTRTVVVWPIGGRWADLDLDLDTWTASRPRTP